MDVKKQESPIRLVQLVITIIVVSACLVRLYFQDPVRVLVWLTGIGIFLGIILLLLGLITIPAIVSERKNKVYLAQGPERLKQHRVCFYCSICGKPCPHQYWDQDGEDGHLYSEYFVVDWDKPTELSQCSRCYKWTYTNVNHPQLGEDFVKNA